MTEKKPNSEIQGEGDYAAARRHRKDLRDFVKHTDVEAVARRAAPASAAEAAEMEQAEAEGKTRAKGS